MDLLIHNAQIHCLYTPQATGLKLKLLNVLFKGRFVIANTHMIHGKYLDNVCIIANSPHDYINAINQYISLEFSDEELHKRKNDLKAFENNLNADTLINFIKN